MRKPIFVTYIPNTVSCERFSEIQKTLKEELKEEYHLLVVSKDVKEFEFQMFSDKDIAPIELDKLKELLNVKGK